MASKSGISIDSDTQQWLWKGAIVAGAYFIVVKPLLNSFGASPADQAAVASVTNTTNDDNPWSIHFSESEYTQNPTMYNSDYWKSLDASNPYYVAGEAIHNAMSLWHNVDQAAVDGAFAGFISQADVANTATYLYFNYNEDLFSLLKNGNQILSFISNGIGETNLAQLVNQVKALPAS